MREVILANRGADSRHRHWLAFPLRGMLEVGAEGRLELSVVPERGPGTACARLQVDGGTGVDCVHGRLGRADRAGRDWLGTCHGFIKQIKEFGDDYVIVGTSYLDESKDFTFEAYTIYGVITEAFDKLSGKRVYCRDETQLTEKGGE